MFETQTTYPANGLLQSSLELELPPADSSRFVPVDFRLEDFGDSGEPDEREVVVSAGASPPVNKPSFPRGDLRSLSGAWAMAMVRLTGRLRRAASWAREGWKSLRLPTRRRG